MEQFGKDVFAARAVADEAAVAEERARARDSLFLAARLRLTGVSETVPVRVRNLSAGGLMAELPDPIALDQSVEVEVRGIGWVPGRVAWQTQGRAGIAFDAPIDPQRARKAAGRGPDAPPMQGRGIDPSR